MQPATSAATTLASAIYEGRVRHRRHLPHAHRFGYRVAMLFIDLDELPALFSRRWLWSLERRNVAQFRRSDYLAPDDIPLDETVRLRVLTLTGSYPRGLSLMHSALSTWLYDQDPLKSLTYEAPLAALKENLKQPDYLQNLIRTYLLSNQHRTTVLMKPDVEFNQRQAADEKARLEAKRAQMNENDLQKIIETAAELKCFQEAPDDPTVLAALPTLKRTDLDKTNKSIPLDVFTGSTVWPAPG